jgi:hypothetical protein
VAQRSGASRVGGAFEGCADSARSTGARNASGNDKVKAFLLTQQGLTGADMAAIFVRAIPEMVRRASRAKQGFICTVSRSGQVTTVAK